MFDTLIGVVEKGVDLVYPETSVPFARVYPLTDTVEFALVTLFDPVFPERGADLVYPETWVPLERVYPLTLTDPLELAELAPLLGRGEDRV